MVTRRRSQPGAPLGSQGLSFKKTSRRVRRAAAKSQLAPKTSSPESSSSPSSASRKTFSNSRRARAAKRGEITHVIPRTRTRESKRAFEHRMNQLNFVERSVNRSRRRKAIIGGLLALVVLIGAGTGAAFVFVNSLNTRLAVSDSSALASVLAVDEDEDEQASVVYTVLAASYEDASAIEIAALVRTDVESGQASLITIPGDVLDADGDLTLSAVYAQDGDAGLVTAIEELAGVDVAHYAHTDAEGLVALVDVLGGVEVTLEDEVSDAQAGSTVLPAGTQTLSGDQALFLCRANEYADPDTGRASNAGLVAAGLVAKLSDVEGLRLYVALDVLASNIETDMGVLDLREFLSTLTVLDTSLLTTGAMPTNATTSNGESVQVVDSDEWETMMERVVEGLSPVADLTDVLEEVNPSSITVTVNNGGGVTGVASAAAELLEADGFDVEVVGNTAMQVYSETLVIYKEEEFAEAAAAIVRVLGQGRTLWNSVHYAFDTDVLVVVGTDWEPSEEGE